MQTWQDIQSTPKQDGWAGIRQYVQSRVNTVKSDFSKPMPSWKSGSEFLDWLDTPEGKQYQDQMMGTVMGFSGGTTNVGKRFIQGVGGRMMGSKPIPRSNIVPGKFVENGGLMKEKNLILKGGTKSLPDFPTPNTDALLAPKEAVLENPPVIKKKYISRMFRPTQLEGDILNPKPFNISNLLKK